MKKLLLILLFIPIIGFTQTKVENFCYDKTQPKIGSLISNPDTVIFFTASEVEPEYTQLSIILCNKYNVVYDSVYSFIYQNTSQTYIPNVERFGLKTKETDNSSWLVINTNNFTQEELYKIYMFGEKIKSLIK